jgi:hypothetical protein
MRGRNVARWPNVIVVKQYNNINFAYFVRFKILQDTAQAARASVCEKESVRGFWTTWRIWWITSYSSSMFSDTTSFSPLKVNRRFRGTYGLHLLCRRISHAINQHEVGSKQPKHLLIFQRTTRRYIPEDITRHGHRCEILKSYIRYTSDLLHATSDERRVAV